MALTEFSLLVFLAYANNRTNVDPRIALGHALAYPTAMVAKILVATVLVALV